MSRAFIPLRKKGWPNHVVEIAAGECDTMAGCDSVTARIGLRMGELSSRIQHCETKQRRAPASERQQFIMEMMEEMNRLRQLRESVLARKNILSQTAGQAEANGFFAAVAERFGPAVFEELKARGAQIVEERKRRRDSQLVGNVIPVGRIGGPKLRREEAP